MKWTKAETEAVAFALVFVAFIFGGAIIGALVAG